ncbi:MAG: sugar ABC transporter ATP-binding protein [Planctomycetota bacterium]
MLYVSHRLAEVIELADRAVVLRDGRNAGEIPREDLTRSSLVRLMVGRDLDPPAERAGKGSSAPSRLELRGLVTNAFPSAAVDLRVAAGELVGLAGLVGAGRTELLETIFGLREPVSGDVLLEGEVRSFDGPRSAAAAGLALVPEDRKLQGLLLEESVRVNVALATLDRRRGHLGLVDGDAERDVAEAQVAELGVRTSGIEQQAETLSGGNQQKVVVGRWLAAEPRVLLLDEPTRGVDVGAREELYGLLERLAADGLGVLFASSDLEELLRLADRIVVLYDGRVSGELDRSEATEEAVMELATGGVPHAHMEAQS